MGLKFCFLGSALLAATLVNAQTKVACVGNSITEGYGIWDKKKYPEHLQDMLGSEYKVENFGHSGRMFHKASGESYWSSDKFTAALNYGANIVVIELGTNDSKYFFDGKGSSSGYNYMYKPENKADLAKDYEALIDTFAHQPQAPTIYATLQPYAQNVEWGIVDTAIVNVINPIIKDVATRKGVKIIDLHSTFNKKEWLLDDVVHPNEEGAKELAKIIADGILNGPSTPISSENATESSSSTLAESSSSILDESSSSSETMEGSSSDVAADSANTDVLRKNTFADQRISVLGNTIAVNNFAGQLTVFDLNGNLIKRVFSNGSAQIQLNRTGFYIIRTGMNVQKIMVK